MATSAADQSGIMALPEADSAPQGNPTAVLTTDSFDGYKTALDRTTPEGGQAMDIATDQIMGHVDQLSDQQLDGLITLLQAMSDHPEQYKEILQAMIEGGNIEEGVFPPEYDEGFVNTLAGLLLNAQHMREKSKGAPATQGIGALPTGMPEGPQGFARGGIAEAVRLVASQGRRGDTMLAHINAKEARILRSMGGSGTINPATGLHEFGFLSDVWNGVKEAVKSVGNVAKEVVGGVVNLAKQIVASPVGRIVATIALATFLGPAGVGLVSTPMMAAGLASGGITLLSGGSVKDAIINGAMAYFAAPGSAVNSAVASATGFGAVGTAAATGALVGTAGGVLQGKSLKDAVTQGLTMGAISAGTTWASSQFGKTGPATAEDALAKGQTASNPTETNFQPAEDTSLQLKPAGTDTSSLAPAQGDNGAPTSGGTDFSNQVPPAQSMAGVDQTVRVDPNAPYVDPNGKLIDPNTGQVLQNNPNYSDVKGQASNTVWQDVKTAGRELASGNFGKAWDAAADVFVPSGDAGLMRTYAPIVAGGLAVAGASGAFEPKKPPETELQKEMNASTLAEYQRVRDNPGNYQIQNQEGVTYNDKGQIIGTGGSYGYKEYTPENAVVDTRGVLGQGPSTYTPPMGAMTNSQGPVAQPYNMYDMYTNLMPQYYQQPRRAATGGIAELAAGGYPRRTGQISGPGTPTSDSIPAMLSDGEFVMTEKAVRSLGGGDRRAGAKKMYALMHHLERNAARG